MKFVINKLFKINLNGPNNFLYIGFTIGTRNFVKFLRMKMIRFIFDTFE